MNSEEPAFSAEQLLKATGGTPLRGGSDWRCRGISTDTRTLREGNLFVALAGERFDGHDWLGAAAASGAAGLLIRRGFAGRLDALSRDLPVIGVPDTLFALGEIAHAWRTGFSIPVAAITGSSGKTTTKEMLAAISSPSRNTLKTEGNLNNRIGLPLTLLRMRPEHRLAIVEMGTNSPGEIARLSAIAEPDVGLITNIGPAHLEGLGSLEAVREEKGALFAEMAGRGTAILNGDDPAVCLLAKHWRGKRIRFGLDPGSDVTARRIEKAGPAAVRFELLIGGSAFPVRLATPGRHNLMNALAAAAAAAALDIDRQAIVEGLSSFRPVPGRTEIRILGNGAFLMIDAYNANPASVREALLTLKDLRGKGRAVAILGDMLELGEQGLLLHEEIGTLLAETGVDDLFLKGALTRRMAAAALRAGIPEDRILFFEDPQRVIEGLRHRLRKGDWILIKGSRKMKLGEVAEAILRAFDAKGETV